MATNLAADNLADRSVFGSEMNGRKLSVLAVIPGGSSGSSFIFARRQVESLRRLGVDIRTFFLSSRTSPVGLWREWRRLRYCIGDFQPDLLHAHYGTVTSLLCAAATNRPLVITFRGSDLNEEPGTAFLRMHLAHLLSQLSCLRARVVICVSDKLRDRLWWRRHEAVVIPTGVDLTLFYCQPKEQARQILGWDNKSYIALFHGGLRPHSKGIDFVERAIPFAQARVSRPIRLIQLNGGVSPEVMPCYLSAADCLVFASRFEGSPNIIKEAMACNLPVVTTDAGDAVERLKGVSPSKVVRRDVVEFGESVADILIQGCRSNGRESAKRVSDTDVARAIVAAYLSALDGSTELTSPGR
jgi:glycosyltransferase involved in cell wall biosynthesis